jgi:hypothetical protein
MSTMGNFLEQFATSAGCAAIGVTEQIGRYDRGRRNRALAQDP